MDIFFLHHKLFRFWEESLYIGPSSCEPMLSMRNTQNGNTPFQGNLKLQ